MSDHQIASAEHVGIIAGVTTFLLSLFGIHRHSQDKLHARIDHLTETKADKEEVMELGQRLENRLDQIYDYLMNKGNQQ